MPEDVVVLGGGKGMGRNRVWKIQEEVVKTIPDGARAGKEYSRGRNVQQEGVRIYQLTGMSE